MQTSAIDVMCAAGAVLLSYGDIALGYPNLFRSAEAARKALRREIHAFVGAENPGQPSFPQNGNPGQTSIN
jgi:hypothetical protein